MQQYMSKELECPESIRCFYISFSYLPGRNGVILISDKATESQTLRITARSFRIRFENVYPVSLTPISKALAQSNGKISARLFAFFSGSQRGASTFE